MKKQKNEVVKGKNDLKRKKSKTDRNSVNIWGEILSIVH